MKIGITGATGQLGRIVIKKLKDKISSSDIVALVRNQQKATDLSVEVRLFDYNHSENLVASLKDIDSLLFISGNEIGQRITQHANVIHAAKKAGVNWIVYTSLLHADTSGLSLATEHLATEIALKESGIPHTILRNGWYSENFTDSVKGAVAAGLFLGSAGNGKISSASRADYAEAAVTVLTTNDQIGRMYELAGDNAYTLADLAAEISGQTGKNIQYSDLPEAEYAQILMSFGLPESRALAIAGWEFAASRNDLFDDSRQLSTLICSPTTPMKDSVKAALA